MSITVRELAEWVEGEWVGDGDQVIDHARPLSEAEPGDITLVENDRYMDDWHHSRASAAVVRPTVPVNGRPLIRVADPLMAFASILKRLRGDNLFRNTSRIHPTACVHPTATIGPDANIGPFVVVGEGAVIGARATLHTGVVVGDHCTIGEDVSLYPHVVIYDNCQFGDRVTVHANSVIGSDGFGYRPINGKHIKVPQLGHVEIGHDVEIGANACIDRGTFGATRIGEGTKIDNLVQIAHNVQIGKHNLLASQVGVAGSCTTGDYVVMAGQVGIADHMTVGAGAQIGAQSGVVKDVPAGERIWGTPGRHDKDTFRMLVCQERLPEMVRDVKRIKQHLGLGDVG